jgi:hypothetical protein
MALLLILFMGALGSAVVSGTTLHQDHGSIPDKGIGFSN